MDERKRDKDQFVANMTNPTNSKSSNTTTTTLQTSTVQQKKKKEETPPLAREILMKNRGGFVMYFRVKWDDGKKESDRSGKYPNPEDRMSVPIYGIEFFVEWHGGKTEMTLDQTIDLNKKEVSKPKPRTYIWPVMILTIGRGKKTRAGEGQGFVKGPPAIYDPKGPEIEYKVHGTLDFKNVEYG